MPNYGKPNYEPKVYSDLFGGHPITTLAEIFGLTVPTVRKALANIEPVEVIGQQKMWTIQQAAPVLVTPTVDIVDQIKSLRPADLPPLLQKDFWAAQRSRQAFLEESRDLWRTHQVLRVMARVMRVVADQMGMLEDTVERQTGLTEDQRRIIRAMVDGARKEMHSAMLEEFKNYQPNEDHDEIHKTADDMDRPTPKQDDEDEW